MAKRGRSKAALRALRKKYGLGEFSKKTKRRKRTRSTRLAPGESATWKLPWQ